MLDDIYIGLGANLPHPTLGPPRRTLEFALTMLTGHGPMIKALSPWYESAPVPISDQPWYINAVARIETTLTPVELLAVLHRVEVDLGRVRSVPNAPRLVDLDILAYGRLVARSGPPPHLPHPRMATRAFVLLPLRDLDPDWRHPETGKPINALVAQMPQDQQTRPQSEGKNPA